MKPPPRKNVPPAKPVPAAHGTPPPAPHKPLLTFIDGALLLVAAAAVFCAFKVGELYNTRRPFPRDPAEFRSAQAALDAKNDAKALLQKEPENIQALMDLAQADFELGQDHYVDGLEALERARELGALDDRLFFYAGVMYEAKGLLDYARPEFERFLRHHPGDVETRLRLGNLYYKIDELDKAIEQYQKVLEQKPDDPLVAFNLAVAYRDREKWNEGLELLNRVIQSRRRLPAGENKLLGELYIGAGKPAQALESFQAELTQNQGDPELWQQMARIYEQQGDLTQALAHWQRASDLLPKDRKIRDKVYTLSRKVKAQARQEAARR